MNRFSSSLDAQRQRLLDTLAARGSAGLTTIEARESLDIMMPAARVHDLRHRYGLEIATIWTVSFNAQGHEHRCARYILQEATA